MMNFGRMNDNYYQPTFDLSVWDAFVDYCEDNGLDYEMEDFDQWKEDQRDLAEQAAADNWADYQREN